MADLIPGEVFTDVPPNNAVYAARLNNLVAGASIGTDSIHAKTGATAATGDEIALFDISAQVIAKTTLGDLFNDLGDAAAGTKSPRSLGSGSTQAAPGTDTRFPASVTGIRKGAGVGSADVAAHEADLPRAVNALGNSGASITIPCVSFRTHTVTMDQSSTLTFTGLTDGALIRILATQSNGGSHTATWAASGYTFKAVGGSASLSTTDGYIDLVTFNVFGTVVYYSVQLHYA